MYKDDDVPFSTGPLAGKTWKNIMDQAATDDEKQRNISDPFAEGEKLYGGSEKTFYKREMKKLKYLINK